MSKIQESRLTVLGFIALAMGVGIAPSAQAVDPLPFVLDFNGQYSGLQDRNGMQIGFTRVQQNRLGNQYRPELLNLDIDFDRRQGVLKVTTFGRNGIGGNFEGDNTLLNGLEGEFDASAQRFTITTRLVGPLNFLSAPYQQAGIQFGPDQDNYVKLIVGFTSSGRQIQFIDEQGRTYHSIDSRVTLPNFDFSTLDLRLTGDPFTGEVFASYSINGGAYVAVPKRVRLNETRRRRFFGTRARAGIIAFQKNNRPPVTFSFDSYAVEPEETPIPDGMTNTRE